MGGIESPSVPCLIWLPNPHTVTIILSAIYYPPLMFLISVLNVFLILLYMYIFKNPIDMS